MTFFREAECDRSPTCDLPLMSCGLRVNFFGCRWLLPQQEETEQRERRTDNQRIIIIVPLLSPEKRFNEHPFFQIARGRYSRQSGAERPVSSLLASNNGTPCGTDDRLCDFSVRNAPKSTHIGVLRLRPQVPVC